jgi:PilZ domain
MSTQLLMPLAGPFADSLPVTEQGCECRVYERHACGLASRCQPASTFGKEDLKWSGTIENVSIGGVGLILERRFEKGTGLAIELPGNAVNDAYVVLAKVVHVRRQTNGTWMLGCKFVSELSEDEVRRLLPMTRQTNETPIDAEEPGSLPAATETSPREADEQTDARLKILPIHLIIQTAAGKTLGCTIPKFGASNQSWPLAAGTIGALRGVNRNGTPWKLRVKVRHCSCEGDNWKLECRLANSTSEADLLGALGERVS